MEKIKVGIVGCGGMGKYHSRYLKKIPDVEITAAAEINSDVLKDYQKEVAVKEVYNDWQEMFRDAKISCVLICLPTFLHYEVVMRAAEKHIDIFCEKPLARTFAHAKKMVEACKKKRVILEVGFVRRFDNFWLKAKEIVDSGILGKPVVWRDIAAGFGPGHIAWFFNKEKGGGPILDGMIHNFDFGNFMFGRPVKVISGLTKLKKSSAVDTGSVWVEYESGDVISNFWSWGMQKDVPPLSGMDMIGPDGVLLFPEAFDSSEFTSRFDPEKEGLFLLRKKGGAQEPIPYKENDMFDDQIKYFIDCVRERKKPCVTGEDGLLALKVALAALKEEKL